VGEARLILKATDASRVQLSKLAGTLGNQTIPQIPLGDRATLGAALGRAPVSAVVVTEASFADELMRRLGATGLPNEREE
jgi:ribosomal protein L7Ae-like RNA K-turn-binding protein